MSSRAPRDTSPRAAALQRAAFARMGPSGRVKAAFEMSEEMRDLLEAGIRARHPDLPDEGVLHETLRLLYGDLLANAVTRARARRGP